MGGRMWSWRIINEIEDIWEKTSASAKPCLLRISKYGINVKYIKGETNVVADALSCVNMMENPLTKMFVPVILADMITSQLPATISKLREIWQHTAKDGTLLN